MSNNDDHHDYDSYEDDFLDDDQGGLAEVLQEQFSRTPWWALSLSMHLFVLLVILPLIQCQAPAVLPPIELTTSIEEVEDVIEEDPPKQPENKLKVPLPPTTDAVDTPTPDVVNETENDMDKDSPQGDPTHVSQEQMNNKFTSGAIGAGANAGGTFGTRDGGGRLNRAKGGGGGVDTERGVMDGLKWLADHQDKNGKWDGDGFMKHDPPSDVCTGAATKSWGDPGLTGLATLAFLGAGHTHRYGEYKDNVKRALRYMMKIQSADGLVGGKRGHYMYNHSIAALALAEAYGMTHSPLIKSSATRAIEYLVDARNPGLAWRYAHQDGDSDVSVTGWCVMALKSAKASGLHIEGVDKAMEEARAYIESMTDPDYGVTGYKQKPPAGWTSPTSARVTETADTHAPNHTPTAIATMCRVFFGYKRNDSRLNSGANHVANQPPVWDTGGGGKPNLVDYYYWYYATLAMFQMGGRHWKEWNKHMKVAIVKHQRKGGASHGSWDPVDAWGGPGGRVYATAINVLSLEIYYRYGRVFVGR